MDAAKGTLEATERYERSACPIAVPFPIDAVKGLPLGMIRRLHDGWQIPAEALIRTVKPDAAGVGGETRRNLRRSLVG